MIVRVAHCHVRERTERFGILAAEDRTKVTLFEYDAETELDGSSPKNAVFDKVVAGVPSNHVVDPPFGT